MVNNKRFCAVRKLSDEIRSISVPGFPLYVTGHYKCDHQGKKDATEIQGCSYSPGFPNSHIVLKYHSASAKVTCMLNKALATFHLEDLTSAMKHQPFSICIHSVDIYLFKFNNGNTKVICEIFSKLTIKTPERRLNK